jgi:hypothetical protein
MGGFGRLDRGAVREAQMEVIAYVLLTGLALVLIVLFLRSRATTKRLLTRYGPLVDADAELVRVKEAAAQEKTAQQRAADEDARKRSALAEEYSTARHTYETLKKELALLEENLEDISFGIYRPHFTFETSAEYKAKLEASRDQQRQLVRAGRAAVCNAQWSVNNSKTEGTRMARQNTKLVLRAFNGECDAAVAKVTWNNITRLEERIRKAFEAINKLGTVLQVSITDAFLRLKLDELRLTHEYEDKRHAELEEQRQIREQMREEEKAQREIEKAREEAEREEAHFEKALESARAEVGRASGEQLENLNAKIQDLQTQLEAARQQKERAVSLAELTKAGYVYVISNIGSFGEDVYKVGMTRRWEPMERIRELSGASVPFGYDVHAMMYSENAPALETALHRWMEDRRMNLVNPRKEFFQIGLHEIEAFARKNGVTIEFTRLAEAREYRETIATRAASQKPSADQQDSFPESLFVDSKAG